MVSPENPIKSHSGRNILGKLNFRSSIYGQLVVIILVISIILFASFGVIYKSVNEQSMNTVIRQNGNNIGSLVEGALYHSMMENDKRTLQNTLDIINTMPNIEDVNMYDHEDNPVYSSFSPDAEGHIDPDCKSCHADFASMFPRNEKAYRIIDVDSQCKMSQKSNDYRHLLIRSPILNERSCYVSDCHFHQESDEVLGSLIIKISLKDQDEAVLKSSREFFAFAAIAALLLVSILILFTWRTVKNPLNALVTVSKAV